MTIQYPIFITGHIQDIFFFISRSRSSLNAVTAVSVPRHSIPDGVQVTVSSDNYPTGFPREYSSIYSAPLCCNLAQIQLLIR